MGKEAQELMRLVGIRQVYQENALKAFAEYCSSPMTDNRIRLNHCLDELERAAKKIWALEVRDGGQG